MPEKSTYIEHYLLFGLPCVGKGEHAKVISGLVRGELQKIEMGELCRTEFANDTQLGREIEKLMWRGELAKDQHIATIVKRFDLKKNTLFDGYPRNMEQAEKYVRKGIDIPYLYGYDVSAIAFNIDADAETVEHRMEIRRKKSRAAGLMPRMDDELDTLRRRIALAKENTPRILEYLDKMGVRIQTLNGNAEAMVKNPTTGKLEMGALRKQEIKDFIAQCRQQESGWRNR